MSTRIDENPTSSTLEAALTYSEKFRFSIIPLKPNKEPYVRWERFQKGRATREEISAWWRKWPNAMIGVVCGSISGIVVIDIDTADGNEAIQKYLPDNLFVPTCKTPRGGKHLYFKNSEKPIHNNTKAVPGCDFRGEGGYVIAPPSVNGEGKRYSWLAGLSLADVELPFLPDAYLSFINSLAFGGYKEGCHTKKKGITNCDNLQHPVTFVEEGIRDHAIFHIANFLARGGCPKEEAWQYLEIFAKSCDPPFPLNEMREKVKSAMKRDWARRMKMAQCVEEWVNVTSGYFSVTELYNELHVVTSEEKSNVRQILHRLCKQGKLERHPNKNGFYRMVQVECEEIDFMNAPTEGLILRWPGEIERYFKTLPKNIIVIAGEPDAGKTAFLLNFVRLNMERHKIEYFSSEMGGHEFRERLSKFGLPLSEWWKFFKPRERSFNFADVIRPDDINIIDFLEVTGGEGREFYRVGDFIKDIYDKLRKGVAIIALQKNPGTDYGLGGARSLEKARLYLAMYPGRIKIIKAKNVVNGQKNLTGMELDFKLAEGCQFAFDGDWHHERNRPMPGLEPFKRM